MKCNIFVYGRTKNEDYRWLQKPNIALNSSFFAKILENNSNSLKKYEKLFMFVSSSDLYMLAYIFKDFSSLDERGRPISFVVGLTCNPKKGREFNYRLPALLLQHNLITNLIQNDLSKVINSNSSFKIEDFDISQVNYLINKDLISDLQQNRTTLNNSILEVAQNLNNKVTTPNLESNFKVTELSTLLKKKNENHKENNTPPILKVAENLNKKVITPNSESNFNAIAKGQSTSTAQVKQEVDTSSLEVNITAINIKNSLINKNTSLMNQLENFDKDNDLENIQSLKNKFEGIIKFKSADLLKEYYDNKRKKGFFEIKSQVIFQYQDFNKLYQELIVYDKKIAIEYEKVIKTIDKWK